MFRVSMRDMIDEDVEMADDGERAFEKQMQMAKALSMNEDVGEASSSAMTRSASSAPTTTTPEKRASTDVNSTTENMSPISDEHYANPMVVPGGRLTARQLSASVLYTSTEETVVVDDATLATSVAQPSQGVIGASCPDHQGGARRLLLDGHRRYDHVGARKVAGRRLLGAERRVRAGRLPRAHARSAPTRAAGERARSRHAREGTRGLR